MAYGPAGWVEPLMLSLICVVKIVVNKTHAIECNQEQSRVDLKVAIR